MWKTCRIAHMLCEKSGDYMLPTRSEHNQSRCLLDHEFAIAREDEVLV